MRACDTSLSFLSISFIGICCLWFSLALKLEENGSGWRCSSGNDKQVILFSGHYLTICHKFLQN